ncbi:MAG TPA: 16S rRNA (guanine(527)-N(7))-methyltransferase RsmG [Syntrophorhabdaceae bacterium]|nr:16S rRNA (guanine(527)-N(7))-methyltransferase RsmG [Syntrophorhabdaceae bacterium]HPU30709.1 16S rRNA (guanine(527)-N(7))-methyltransferase RsmG [Syntrophorhabdaceae bacterium]
MMLEEEIKKGLDYFEIFVDQSKLKKLSLYISELDKWNKHINLTGKKDIPSIIRELLYDSFFVYKLIEKGSSFLDMGSGSGILSIPIAIINRDIEVFSVEKNTKKIHFQRHIKRLLRLNRFYPLFKRIELLDNMSVDIIGVKAFGKTEIILEKAVRLLRIRGKVIILKGKNAKPVEFEGLEMSKNLTYSLPCSEKTYKLFEYTLKDRNNEVRIV